MVILCGHLHHTSLCLSLSRGTGPARSLCWGLRLRNVHIAEGGLPGRQLGAGRGFMNDQLQLPPETRQHVQMLVAGHAWGSSGAWGCETCRGVQCRKAAVLAVQNCWQRCWQRSRHSGAQQVSGILLQRCRTALSTGPPSFKKAYQILHALALHLRGSHAPLPAPAMCLMLGHAPLQLRLLTSGQIVAATCPGCKHLSLPSGVAASATLHADGHLLVPLERAAWPALHRRRVPFGGISIHGGCLPALLLGWPSRCQAGTSSLFADNCNWSDTTFSLLLAAAGEALRLAPGLQHRSGSKRCCGPISSDGGRSRLLGQGFLKPSNIKGPPGWAGPSSAAQVCQRSWASIPLRGTACGLDSLGGNGKAHHCMSLVTTARLLLWQRLRLRAVAQLQHHAVSSTGSAAVPAQAPHLRGPPFCTTLQLACKQKIAQLQQSHRGQSLHMIS